MKRHDEEVICMISLVLSRWASQQEANTTANILQSGLQGKKHAGTVSEKMIWQSRTDR